MGLLQAAVVARVTVRVPLVALIWMVLKSPLILGNQMQTRATLTCERFVAV